jgi:5-methylcytosine-specific restriction protein A
MSFIDDVLSNYSSATISNPKTNPTTGKIAHCVPASNNHPALHALRVEIPELFKNAIVAKTGGIAGYATKGSCGQLNFSFAKVPWVGAFKTQITTGATEGYYIVLLFSEDMQSAYLTLNQGFTAFLELYGSPTLAVGKIRDCASEAAKLIGGNSPAGFVSGQILLGASKDLGQGYEAGCILSKKYMLNDGHTNLDVTNDFSALLDSYQYLVNQLAGAAISSLDITVDEATFQAAASDPQNNGVNRALPAGGLPLPPTGTSGGKTKFLRSPAVAGRVVSKSKGLCALATPAAPHKSFLCGRRKVNYVEGHHLIPFSQQIAFAHTIDVDENVVPLCPNCHKLLHHGKMSERVKLLNSLLTPRAAGLAARQIPINITQLTAMYGHLSDDD